MINEVLQWGEHALTVSQGDGKRKILPSEGYGDTVTLPDQAEVVVQNSVPNWGGYDGTTFFVNQTPPVHLDGYRGPTYDQTRFSLNDTSLFGRMSAICPDGTYYPPQLPQILEHVERNWGWRVDQRVKDLLTSSHPRGV